MARLTMLKRTSANSKAGIVGSILHQGRQHHYMNMSVTMRCFIHETVINQVPPSEALNYN